MTAVGGANRNFHVSVNDGGDNEIQHLLADNVAANTTRTYEIDTTSDSGLDIHRDLWEPMFLPEGWYIHIDDHDDIDGANDTVAYTSRLEMWIVE